MKNDMKNVNNIELAEAYFGLTKTFTISDLKHARRRLTTKFHPDKAPQDLKEEYTKKVQEINHYYDLLLPFCVSQIKKIEGEIKKTKSIKHVFYGFLILLLLPILFFGGIIKLVLSSYPWYTFITDAAFLEFTLGMIVYLFTFFIYFLKFRLPFWLFLLQIISILMIFNILNIF